MIRLRHIVTISACALLAFNAHAREFRTFNAITSGSYALPEGAVAVEGAAPVERATVQEAVGMLVGSWNSGDLEKHLSESFYDKRRLVDTIGSNMPRDAKLTVLSLQSHHSLGVYEKDGERHAKVNAVVQTQIEFNDPVNGYQRIPGTIELTMTISGI